MSTMNAQLPGVFYRRPSPEQDPFIEEGGTVEPGQLVALIEVMKTFNEVKADRSGTISKFLLNEGDEVEAGQGIVEVDEA
ncbi:MULTISPECIES: acetyl-CoA carboxylase [Actinopolyspora]|uniref:Biotin carboxyl carrier protein of acetyl-CoA carboxylase n=1 Tax=Actinopolyspora saharensis TaxID=995062 RepID=A0A1H1AKB1_9ACTN|nr:MULTISPECIES: acetyl-CoA carboxylase [Actinopolyspora]NHD17013.1 biotin carboxyl carrier domain-containing protein [Actinopolyspora sp. BKK2]NHE76165.1 biotin carboxyl carrier domain-containing protein [Actinopolyspora sp. BKK1]SDQ39626.1 Biotin-requiring enzyme [Actinopolyspora saharensis]